MSNFLRIHIEECRENLVINVNHISKIYNCFDRRIVMCDGSEYILTVESYDNLMRAINASFMY